MDKLTDFCEDKRHFRPQNNAARERSRAVPPNTKLSKLDILVLATAYIYHLTQTLDNHDHPQADCKNGTTFSSRQNLTLTSNRIYQDNGAVHSTDNCIHYTNPSLASTSPMKQAPSELLHSRNNRLKSFKNAETYNKHSSQLCTSHHPDSFRRNNFPQSKHLPSKEVKRHQLFTSSQQLAHGTVGFLHPVKKWPMRSRLYDSILGRETSTGALLSTSTATSLSCFVQSKCTSNDNECPKQNSYQ